MSLRNTYKVMRASGFTRVGAVFTVTLMALAWPFIALAEWATPHKDRVGQVLWRAWREPPPTQEETEQYHDAKMKAESGLFEDDWEEMPSVGQEGECDGKMILAYRDSEDSLRLEALKTAVQVGLADSTAGRYTEFNSAKALAHHLESLATKANK
jgi:hypothetical protein